MIPTSYTNNTTPVNIRPNTAATQDNQASTNTSLTTTNWNSSFTVAPVDNPRPRNMITNPLATFAIGIGILCRYVAPTVAETTESILTYTLSNLNVTISASSINSTTVIGGLYTVLGLGFSISVMLILLTRRIICSPTQKISNAFCNLKYKNLPVAEIDIKEFKDSQCLICLRNFDTSASTTSLNSINSNESTDTKGEWVLYEKQLYHFRELQEAVSKNKKIPHTQQAPNPSKLQAVNIVQALNDIPNTSVGRKYNKKPESFIVDVPERQDMSQFSKNDNDEESKPFL